MRQDLVAVTVVYTGMGDPAVHARGCADVARALKLGAPASEDLDVRDGLDLAGRVYADQIAEGAEPEDLTSAFDYKPCVRSLTAEHG